MKKVEFNIPIQKAEDATALIEKLKGYPEVQQLIQRNNCSLDMVDKYPHKFHEWLKGKKRCTGCQGLAVCKQDVQGEWVDLEFEGVWMPIIKSCDYKRKIDLNLAHMNYYVVCDMPEQFKTLKMEELQIRGEKPDYITQLMKVVEWLKNPKEKGFYLYGPVGVGKSHLAACATNYFARKQKRVAYVNVPEWITRMKANFSFPDEMAKELSAIKKAEFVVFDDIGAESVTPWVRDELFFPVLNARMENKKKTWFTSNEDFSSLENHFEYTKQNQEEKMKAIRIMERIKTLAQPFGIIGENRRNIE